mgnify:CR=1 FL=1
MSSADRARQRRWKAAQHERGQVRLQLWVPADQADQVHAFVATLTPPERSQGAPMPVSPRRPENAPGALAAGSPDHSYPQPQSPLQRQEEPEAAIKIAFQYRPNAALRRELARNRFQAEDDQTWESPILPAIEIEALRAWAATLKDAIVIIEPIAE